ncbi:MAG: PEP/pyruvate-binding domain-containing protein [Coprococcus sp.]
MKAENLILLQQNHFRVPQFMIVNGTDWNESDLFEAQSYAVRSSFDAEDSAKQSYAGQFKTLLYVKRQDIRKAVYEVRESYENCLEYDSKSAHHNGKVIIQEMIDADYSGVIFTANPMGILNEIVVVVGKGIGCQVVEDKIGTTSYYYNTDDALFYQEQTDDSPLLQDSLFEELITIAKKIQQLFQRPMDIEYCIKDDTVYVLQARPITTLRNQSPIILDNSNIVESYPGVSLPLTQSFVKEIYYKVFRYCILHLSKDENLVNDLDTGLRDMVDVANNRIYYRISNWYSVLNLLPFSRKIIGIWQDMLGVENKEVHLSAKKVSVKTKIQIIRSFIGLLTNTPKKMDELNAFFSSQITEYRKRLDALNTVDSLLELYEEIKEELVQRWDITLVNDMYTFIYTHLAGGKNKQNIGNIKNLESMKPLVALTKLKKTANQYGFAGEEYLKERKQYIDEYGDRGLHELKLETKTYRTNPELLDDYIRNNDFSFTEEKEEVSGNLFVRRAKTGIKNREISRMNRSKIFGLTRDIFRKIGELFVEQHKIMDSEDIFYLTIPEIKSFDLQPVNLPEKKLAIENSKQVPDYSRLVFDERIIDKHINGFCKLLSADCLYGIGTSSGCADGEVYVVDDVSDLNAIPKGKILVTKTTDPGWVFLIKNATAIISEKGSLLSHTAIITRELQKPSVVNVKNATVTLKNGMRVLVDGSRGIVQILEW